MKNDKLFLISGLFVFIVLLFGCATDHSYHNKNDFLKENFFYNISYEEFINVTPNLENIYDLSKEIDPISGFANWPYGSLIFDYKGKYFFIQGLTPTSNASFIHCQIPVSGNNYSEIIKQIANHLGKPISNRNHSDKGIYIWKINEEDRLRIYLNSNITPNKIEIKIGKFAKN